MNWHALGEFSLKVSAEGRAWAQILAPVALAWLHGWSLPQAGWAKPKSQDPSKEEG